MATDTVTTHFHDVVMTSIAITIVSLHDEQWTFSQLNENTTIESLKYLLLARTSVSVDDQRYIWAGRQLENERTLLDYNIPDGGTIYVVRVIKNK